MSEVKCEIPKFDGKDFQVWKKHITIILKNKALLEQVVNFDESKFNASKDSKAQEIILGGLDKSVAQKVVNCDMAHEMWARILSIYENTSAANTQRLLQEFYTYKKPAEMDIATHVSRIESMALQLEQLGQKRTEEELMAKLLGSLPKEFDALIEAWDSVHPDFKKMDVLLSRLLMVEMNLTPTAQNDEALIAKQVKETIASKKRRTRCHKCHQLGHWARECPKQAEEPDVALVLSNQIGDSDERWIVDSGASRHTCARREYFTTYKQSTDKVRVGNKQVIEAIGCGNVHLTAYVHGVERNLILRNVLHVPSISRNLVSTGAAAQRGVSIFLNSQCCIMMIGKNTIARANYDPGTKLYILNARVKIAMEAHIIQHQRTMNEWHKSLAHINEDAITNTINKNMVEGAEIVSAPINHTLSKCLSCLAGKQAKASHTITSQGRQVSDSGQRVSLDLVEPIGQESLGKNRFFLLATDRHSDYTYLFPLKTKNEVAEKIQHLISKFEVDSGKRIKVFEADNGSEFKNTQVKLITDLEHIMWDWSAPYTPQQNGKGLRARRPLPCLQRPALNHVLDCFESSKINAIVSDAASACTKARADFVKQDKYKHIIQQRCFAHSLNLIGKDVSEHPECQDILKKVSQVVAAINGDAKSWLNLPKRGNDAARVMLKRDGTLWSRCWRT